MKLIDDISFRNFRIRWLSLRMWRWRWNKFKYKLNPDLEYEAWLAKEKAEARALLDSLDDTEGFV